MIKLTLKDGSIREIDGALRHEIVRWSRAL